MSDDDWETGDCALGMYLNGQGIAGLDERGGRITDDHFLLYVNACPDDLTVVLPPEEYAGRWTAVVDTAGSADPSTPLAAGEKLTVPGRSMLVLQEWAAAEEEVDSSVDASVRAQSASSGAAS
jgi:glycogen operon protein